MESNTRIEVYQKNLERVIHWISIADSKASGLLAIWAITATGFGASISSVIKSLRGSLSEIPVIVVISFACLYLIVAIITLVRLISVIYPRQRKLDKLSSPLYGESISNLEEADFLTTLNNLTEEDVAEHLAKQTWRMQNVCTSKYTDLSRSRLPLIATVVLILLYLFVSGFALRSL